MYVLVSGNHDKCVTTRLSEFDSRTHVEHDGLIVCDQSESMSVWVYLRQVIREDYRNLA